MSALEDAIAEALAPVVGAQVRAAVREVLEARPDTYSIEEVSRIFRCGKEAISELIDAGLLWVIPLPTQTKRIPRQALEELMARPSASVTQIDRAAS